MRVAFQGEQGAYSEAAVFGYFGDEVQAIPCDSFELVFDMVDAANCDAGMIPIENSVAGSIHRNYDLLLEHTLNITAEYHLRVRHCLIANPGTSLTDVKKVISHPQALSQCRHFLNAHPQYKIEAVYDTAGSIKMIKENRERSIAGIASARAAEVYGMKILASGIEDNPENYTRFLVISKEPVVPSGEAKTSIVFSFENQPGALFKALSVFALRDIDLAKIESRPLVGRLWEYYFYIDLIGSVNEPRVNKALDHLGEFASMLRILGSYPRHRFVVDGGQDECH